ncbi:MAG TPA: hypothetical protein VGD71_29790 [Kribbella sp.]
MAGTTQAINIVLDGPPDLTAGSGRFVEVEIDDGHSIAIGAWTQRPDGYWSLRIDGVPIPQQPSTTDRPDEAATGDPTP